MHLRSGQTLHVVRYTPTNTGPMPVEACMPYCSLSATHVMVEELMTDSWLLLNHYSNQVIHSSDMTE